MRCIIVEIKYQSNNLKIETCLINILKRYFMTTSNGLYLPFMDW